MNTARRSPWLAAKDYWNKPVSRTIRVSLADACCLEPMRSHFFVFHDTSNSPTPPRSPELSVLTTTSNSYHALHTHRVSLAPPHMKKQRLKQTSRTEAGSREMSSSTNTRPVKTADDSLNAEIAWAQKVVNGRMNHTPTKVAEVSDWDNYKHLSKAGLNLLAHNHI
jgi:hypothetical protein